MSGTVAAVILAAGESRRFGGAKQLALLEGRTLLEHVLLRAAERRPGPHRGGRAGMADAATRLDR